MKGKDSSGELDADGRILQLILKDVLYEGVDWV
jgi:hypothetical protein